MGLTCQNLVELKYVIMSYLLAYLSVFSVFSQDAIPGEMVAIQKEENHIITDLHLQYSWDYELVCTTVVAYHACSRVLPNEGIPQDLRQLASSKRGVWFVSSQGADTFLRSNT